MKSEKLERRIFLLSTLSNKLIRDSSIASMQTVKQNFAPILKNALFQIFFMEPVHRTSEQKMREKMPDAIISSEKIKLRTCTNAETPSHAKKNLTMQLYHTGLGACEPNSYNVLWVQAFGHQSF
jgi:hypothetical protein